MNTQHDPTDDVIELTDIIEEGDPENTDFDDFAMDGAVDAESLDKELDALLREDLPAAAHSVTDAKPDTEAPASATEPRQNDLSDLDDLFDSLQLDDGDDGFSSLDMLLDEKSATPGVKDEAQTTEEDTIDLDLDIPDLQPAESEPDLLELTDDLLADIPDTVLVSPAGATEPTAPESSTLFVPEGPEEGPEDTAPAEQPATMAEPRAEEPIETAPAESLEPARATEPAEKVTEAKTAQENFDVAQSHLEILSSRIDALEARPEPAAGISPELLLSAMPESPGDLPLARALREEIMQAVDEKVAALTATLGVAEVRQMAEDATARLDALESAPAPETELAPEKVLAAMPESPEDLPLARTLREGIMQAVDEKVAALTATLGVAEVRQMAEDAVARLADLENAPAPETELAPEKVLAAMPESPEDLPLARTLRDELVRKMDENLAGLAPSEAVEELRGGLDSVREQVDAMPETLARLSASTTPALQDLENGVSSLNTLVEELRQSLAETSAALAEREETLALMREEGERMREEIEALNARLDAGPDATALRNDLEEHVRQQVPATVARVIRKEIQALLKEMEG
jgi:hypothetical protein